MKVLDDPAEEVYPMPMLAVNDEAVLVGRLRAGAGAGLDLFLAIDDVRRGVAANALRVAELLGERHLAH